LNNLTIGNGSTQIEVHFEGENFWLSLNQISSLLEKDKYLISRHLRNIFTSGELNRDSVVAKNATTASDGKTYVVDYYNLDAIISVGYRVNSNEEPNSANGQQKLTLFIKIERTEINIASCSKIILFLFF
jgi:hypothetical protein